MNTKELKLEDEFTVDKPGFATVANSVKDIPLVPDVKSRMSQIQKEIDKEAHKDFLGIKPKIGGIEIEPVTLQSVSLLGELGSELLEVGSYNEVKNPLYEVAIFFMCHSPDLDLDHLLDVAEMNPRDKKKAILTFAKTLKISSLASAFNDMTTEIAKATSARAEAKEDKEAGKGGRSKKRVRRRS